MADTLYRESASVVSTFPMLKGFLNPLVEAHSGGLCGGNNFGVELGGNPYHKLSGKAFEWLDSIFTAHIKEDLKRRMSLVGKPVIKGTRLTVEYILNLLAHGSISKEILQEYEGLTQEDMQACLLFITRSLQDTEFMPLSLG